MVTTATRSSTRDLWQLPQTKDIELLIRLFKKYVIP